MSQDIRVENPRQVSLLGFYGVTPDVDIAIREFNQPIERLAFYFYTQGTGDGRGHHLSLELYEPEGNRFLGPIVTAPEGIAPPAPAVITVAVVFTSQNLVFRLPGRYRILLRADDSDEGSFDSSFTVRQGPPALFQ